MLSGRIDGHFFVARQSVYFWISVSFWSLLAGYAVLGAAFELIGPEWLLVGLTGLATIATIVYLLVRSGVAIHRDGGVVIKDGLRTVVTGTARIKTFIIVDNVHFLAAGLLSVGSGVFTPDRLGVQWQDGTTTRLNWSFANHDDIRTLRKELNRELGEVDVAG